jgi:phosphodiesterase/alkaline phosphatase D-like protein
MFQLFKRVASILGLVGLSACTSTVIARGPVYWVWSGAVTERSAVVKTRVELTEAGAPRLLVNGQEVAAQDVTENGVATFRLEGLNPEKRYDYRVRLGPSEFLSGHFSTFAQGPMSFHFVFGSCARTASNHPVFETMQRLEPLFVLHMGDFHYENIAENDAARYREAFDRVLASERQAALYRSTPIVYIWDDHDYGPNDADGTHPGKPSALATYDQYVPHYPLEREGPLLDLHQAFTVGRIRFLLTDPRSERVADDAPDGPEKTMLGAEQREWLLNEIEGAKERYPLVVWVNPVPWISEAGSSHGWGAYDWERRYIADRIRRAGMTRRMLMLSGDGHMVAIDDGTNSNYATSDPPEELGFPVVHAAPFDRYPRPKGGPYSHGIAARRLAFGIIQIQQFGLAHIRDDGETIEVDLSGRNARGELLEGMSLQMRCDDNGCRTVS